METNKNDLRDQEDLPSPEKNAEESLPVDTNAAENTTPKVEKETHHHHHESGHHRYKSYRNHSSADDQPRTNTGI